MLPVTGGIELAMSQFYGSHAAMWRRRLAPAIPLTIRGNIFAAFAAMTTITAILGLYATLTIRRSADLVVGTYDRSLMSISFARAAAADFAGLQLASGPRSSATRNSAAGQMPAGLVQTTMEDLRIAAERAQSSRALGAADDTQSAIQRWLQLRSEAGQVTARPMLVADMDHAAQEVERQIDRLINLTAGDGFIYRQKALASIRAAARLNGFATFLALVLSITVTILLARRIVGPVMAASAVAERIAHGELEVDVPRGRPDELGRLLDAMAIMRDSIQTAMAAEVAQRRSAERHLVDAIESSREGVMLLDAENRLVVANSQAVALLGDSQSLQIGDAMTSLPDASSGAEELLVNNRWLRLSRSRTQDGGVVAICSDITATKQRESALQTSNLCLDAALSNMSQGLCLFDADHRLRIANRRFYEIFRIPPERVQPGSTLRAVLECSVAAGNYAGRTIDEIYTTRLAVIARNDSGPHLEQLSDGRVISVLRGRLSDGGWVTTFEDVTERRRVEAEILHLASHDPLTGLPNRLLFRQRLEHALALLQRGTSFAVHCLDLDGFKDVNDTLGHAVGDTLLRAVADRFAACARDVDTVARLGGDEFAVIQIGIGSSDDAAVLAARMIAALRAPFELGEHRVTVGASAGIAIPPQGGGTCEALLQSADLALYRAKDERGGSFLFFEPKMAEQLQIRKTIEADLRYAIERDELELHFQPLIDLETNDVTAVEALLRWNHPTRGIIGPGEFIPIAEESGLIIALGEWVLHMACREASRWTDRVRVAVNVSPVQFRSADLLQAISDALDSSQLPASRLEIEITESILLHENEATLATLRRIQEIGVRVSLDDFGTGYSSLSYLRRFPFDKIKIDQSFVRDLFSKDESASIIRAVTGLARSLGIRVTAEGVETNAQLARLRAEGCTEVQGYLLSKPLAARDISNLIHTWNGLILEMA
jgi:diguanylate cyclase (GGDEF)-like protein